MENLMIVGGLILTASVGYLVAKFVLLLLAMNSGR